MNKETLFKLIISYLKKWLYLSDDIILNYLTNETGRNAISHFIDRTLTKAPYKEKIDYRQVDKDNILVKKYFKNNDFLACKPGNRKKYFIITKKTLKVLLESRKYRVVFNPTENKISDKLALKYNGEREVFLKNSRRIDVVTDKYIIEVKSYRSRLSAVGQILYYGLSYPGKKKVIHLFKHGGKRDTEFEDMCRDLEILVSYE